MLEKILLRIMAICSLVLFILLFVNLFVDVFTHAPEWRVIIGAPCMFFIMKFSFICFDKLEEIEYREQETWAEEEDE